MKNILNLSAIIAVALAPPTLARPAKGSAHHGVSCAQGLSSKGCMPPGQAKKRYKIGFKFNLGFNQWTPYTEIPRELRVRYSLSPSSRYIYDQNYVYRVDPVTLAVSQVITAVLR